MLHRFPVCCFVDIRMQDRRGHRQFKENMSDPVGGLRPCANVTLQSLTQASLDYMVCVVLTGMGADGYLGINELRNNHNLFTIAQSKETCVVYGMPRAIVEHGIADLVLPLESIGKEINKKMGVH